MTKSNTLIRPEQYQFVSREEFINATGIFVTPDYFERIYERFLNSDLSVEQFIRKYETDSADDIRSIPLSGTFKFNICDDDLTSEEVWDYENEDVLPNITIWEIMNSLALNHSCTQSENVELYYKNRQLAETVSEFEMELKALCEQFKGQVETIIPPQRKIATPNQPVQNIIVCPHCQSDNDCPTFNHNTVGMSDEETDINDGNMNMNCGGEEKAS